MAIPKFFVSYSRKDSEFVKKLVKELRDAKASLWLDSDLEPGVLWDSAIEKALNNCEGLLIILSEDSVSSINVQDEISFALDERKIIIPVLIKNCTIPFRIRRLQYIDLFSNYTFGLSKLMVALKLDIVADGNPFVEVNISKLSNLDPIRPNLPNIEEQSKPNLNQIEGIVNKEKIETFKIAPAQKERTIISKQKDMTSFQEGMSIFVFFLFVVAVCIGLWYGGKFTLSWIKGGIEEISGITAYESGIDDYNNNRYNLAAVNFEKAISKGAPTNSYFLADASHHLGWLYQHGLGVQKNFKIAYKWYEESNTPSSCKNIGNLYAEGYNSFQQDWHQALIWYRKSAEMGNAISMRKVGEVYQYGKGVVIDKDKAKLWYRKASKAGDSIATVRLNEPFEILNLGIKPRKFLFDKHLKN